MSEAAFERKVREVARLYGWRAYHTHDSRRSDPGWPDLVLIRPPRLVFAELKSASGRLSGPQRQWLEDLSASGQEVALWRPDDFPEIVRVLKGSAKAVLRLPVQRNLPKPLADGPRRP